MAAKQISLLQRARFVSLSALLYVVTIASIGFAAYTPIVAAKAPVIPQSVKPSSVQPTAPKIVEISGIPNRITMPSAYKNIDLPVVPGVYDEATDSWTLNGYMAQFATASAPANNVGGETFIYGHNNDYVFGALRHVTPPVGTDADVYTTNGHEFEYTFEKTWSVGPYDVSTVDYQGSPVLLIQTCTGSLNQYRTMYLFTFVRVIQ